MSNTEPYPAMRANLFISDVMFKTTKKETLVEMLGREAYKQFANLIEETEGDTGK
jgi:hypothetical protein